MDYNELKNRINQTSRSGKVRNPRRYRLDFIKENTFNRLWSIRMTRTRVWLGAVAFLAAVAALIFVVFAFTPMKRLIPMRMEKATRAGYLEASLRLDSLERAVERQNLYTSKVSDILEGRSTADSIAAITASGSMAVDSASIEAREAEKRFVKTYENDRNFNLSVLAPIAAEGMDFSSPAGGMASHTREAEGNVLELSTGRTSSATAVYKGTVVAIIQGSDGLSSVMIQHPNDFISIYGGLREVYVEKGASVVRSQRIGQTAPPRGVLYFELWHKGAALRPADYINAL